MYSYIFYYLLVATLSHIFCACIQGCQLAGLDGFNIGKFDQVNFSIDSDSNVVISYDGGDSGRCVQFRVGGN